MDNLLSQALQDIGANRIIDEAAEDFLVDEVAGDYSTIGQNFAPEQFIRLALVAEREGLNHYNQLVQLNFTGAGSPEEKKAFESARRQVIRSFEKAFFCWRSLFAAIQLKTSDVSRIDNELLIEGIQPSLNVAFRLAAAGLLTLRSAEVRLELVPFASPANAKNWRDRTISNVYSSFVLLTRKSNGYSDIDQALKNISTLREEQKQFEETYLNAKTSDAEKMSSATELIGFYHLAQIITLTAEYLQTGRGSASSLTLRLEKHRNLCNEALKTIDAMPLAHLATLLQIGCRELIQNSIWTHAALVPTPVRDYMHVIAERGSPNPVLELWPAQQEALNRNLLTTYHRAILVQMPTSAGKTLLAKFAIIQSLALNSTGTVAYIVPTRALVNQVTFELRQDFSQLQKPIRVEQAIPAFELDPSEDLFLQTAPDVLVTTPEKLDLLIRKDHAVTQNLAMVIADEAHNIKDENRGARLELLLGTIKRDRPSARFLMLSPWLPNNSDLLAWLGEQQSLDAITVDWRPSNRVVGAVSLEGRQSKRALYFEALPAADNSDIKRPLKFVIGSKDFVSGSNSIEHLTQGIVKALGHRGTVLILCRGPGTSMTRAQQIADSRKSKSNSPEIEAVAKYLELEIGNINLLSSCLRKKIGFHHAGVSHESRWLIEVLAKRGFLDVICGTNTLAQGVNFPISTVIVESFQKGNTELTYHDFWNIAGRAGRALKDSIGVVAFPSRGKGDKDECLEFLEGEAQEIVSQITQLIARADEIGQEFDLKLIAQNPGLSSLLQFLAHAMRVANQPNMAEDVEDILRASLAYYQLRKTDPVSSQKLVTFCRNYILHLQSKKNLKGLLAIADQTGFATPSVLKVLAVSKKDQKLSDAATWDPTTLFGKQIDGLTRRMEIVGDIPEINLGVSKGQPFNPERIASILRDWVNGETLTDMAKRYPMPGADVQTDLGQLTNFSRYMYSQLVGKAAWGLGALENICLAGTEQEVGDAGYVPSMVFFGVKSKEAVWLRTIGVPRALASGLSEKWPAGQVPESFDDIRHWVSNLNEADWKAAIPKGAQLTPSNCKLLWSMLMQ